MYRGGSVDFVSVKARVAVDKFGQNYSYVTPSVRHPYFPVTYLKQRLKEATTFEDGQMYSDSTTGQHTRSLLPTVGVIYKVMGHFKYSFAMAQTLTWHGCLWYGYRYKI